MKDRPFIAAPVLLLCVMALSAVLNFIDTDILGEGETAFLSVALLQFAVLVIPALLYCRLLGRSRADIRLRFFPLSDLKIGIFAAFVLIFGSVLISYAMTAIGVTGSVSSSYSDYIPEGFSNRARLIALAFALVPALTEEYLCRGVFFHEYEGGGLATAVLLSSLCFSLLHFSVQSFPVYFFSGVILALTAFATRSVLCSALVHLLYNLYILFFSGYVERLSATPRDSAFVLGTSALLFLLFAALFFGQCERHFLRSAKENRDADAVFQPNLRKFNTVTAVLSPTLLAAAVMYVILIFVVS